MEELKGLAEIQKKKIIQKIQDQNNILDKNLFSNNIDELEKMKEEQESIISNIEEFTDFIVVQIKELFYQNESRSILLEKRINKHFHSIDLNSSQLKQFFRILQEENGILIQRFWEFYRDRTPRLTLNEIAIQQHYQYNTLCDFLKEANENPPTENYTFQKYLEIQTFLFADEESNNNDDTLEKKTKNLCDLLSNQIFNNSKNGNQGTFLLIKYKSSDKQDANILENTFLAYNDGNNSSHIRETWHESDSYIAEIMNGAKNPNTNGDSKISIDVLKKENDDWESMYSASNKVIKIDFLARLDKIKYVLIVRLSLKQIDEKINLQKDLQGVLVFYSDIQSFSITKTRYLLLLKQSIGEFIHRHHKNDAFKDWVDQQVLIDQNKQRFESDNHSALKHARGIFNYIDKSLSKNETPVSFSNDKTWELYLLISNVFISKLYNSIDPPNKTIKLTEELITKIKLFPDYFKNIVESIIHYNDKKIEIQNNIIGSSVEICKTHFYTFILQVTDNCLKHASSNIKRIIFQIEDINGISYISIENIVEKDFENETIDLFWNSKWPKIRDISTQNYSSLTLITINAYCKWLLGFECGIKIEFENNRFKLLIPLKIERE